MVSEFCATKNKLSLTLLVSTVDVGSNGLSGSIPTEIGLLSNLQYLILNNNDLKGPIPNELGEIATLQL
jgi:Leucine-rich repeat (LRR) protein